MRQSLLLQLARDSIEEVFQAKNIIDRDSLLKEHPILEQRIPTSVKIYINQELKWHSQSSNQINSLLYEIIIHAKKAAFESTQGAPLKSLEYLSCVIELTLETPDGIISQRDTPILEKTQHL